MSRKNKTLTLNVSSEDKAALEQLALDFGQTWGEKPNISGFLAAIAKGHIRVDYADVEPPSNPKRAAMLGAIALIQEGLSKLLRLF